MRDIEDRAKSFANYIIENRAKRDPLYKTGIQRVSNEMLLDYQKLLYIL